ncbi:MAG: phosphoglycerate mutase family protein [Anaerocolumna sp.]
MKNIITIQHTQSVHHTNGMVGAWTDWELTELGRKQAFNISNELKNELIENDYVVYSSDLQRAIQTAEPLLQHTKSKLIIRKDSDNIASKEPVKTQFFTEMRNVIYDFNNNIKVYDTIDLYLAKRP